jgi:hypothetical protein
MEPQNDLFRRAVSNPVRLCAARERNALGRDPVILRPLEIRWRRGAVHVALLGRVEVTELHAHHTEYYVFEVRGRACRALERRDP